MKETIKGVFFDLDGVIIDSDPLWNYIVETIINKFDLDTNILKETDGYNLSTEEAIKTILEHSNRYTLFLYSEILAYIDQLYAGNFKEKTSLMEGMLTVLDWLKGENKTLILVSNSSRIQVDLIVNHYRLGSYFNNLITSNEVKRGKPDKEAYIKALELSGFKKTEVLVVEDSLTGINSAKNAGLNYVVTNKDSIPNEKTIKHAMFLAYMQRIYE